MGVEFLTPPKKTPKGGKNPGGAAESGLVEEVLWPFWEEFTDSGGDGLISEAEEV